MTARIIRALENPRVTMLGHLTGRLLLRARRATVLNVGKVIDAAIANRVVIELNANPQRLDMDWRHWRRAAGARPAVWIKPDAHDTAGLEHVRAGVNVARKGWLTRAVVLNTRPRAAVAKWLRDRRCRPAGCGRVFLPQFLRNISGPLLCPCNGRVAGFAPPGMIVDRIYLIQALILLLFPLGLSFLARA